VHGSDANAAANAAAAQTSGLVSVARCICLPARSLTPPECDPPSPTPALPAILLFSVRALSAMRRGVNLAKKNLQERISKTKAAILRSELEKKIAQQKNDRARKQKDEKK
jgi:hypothetical protein